MRKPNLVVIMADEMRGDAMGIAGHPDVLTPHLDSLAATGVYFPHAYSACPTCVPARATLMTGMKACHTGRVGYLDGVPWRYEHTLAGELSRAGYHTECCGKLHTYPLRNSLGFHHVELHDGHLHYFRGENAKKYEYQPCADDYFYWLRKEKGIDCDVNDTGMDCNSWLARPWPYEEKTHPTRWVTDRSIDFLRRRDREQPFFLFTSYVRPHAPYDAPQAFFDMYANKALRPPFSGDWDDRERLLRQGRIYNNSVGPLDEELIRRQQMGYYACITQIDYEIGRLLSALTEAEVLNNTVILFLSDHGELLSDHCLNRKSLPYEGSARVPMIVNGPERLIGPSRVDESLVELMDVMPTLLTLAGAEIPENVDGKNMLAPMEREYLHGEHIYEGESAQFIVTKRDKFVWYSGQMKEQYFDLTSDPTESRNRISDPDCQNRIQTLRNWLIRELEGREEGFSDGRSLLPGSRPSPVMKSLRKNDESRV